MKKFVLASLLIMGCFVGGRAYATSFVDNEYGVPERSTQEIDYEVVTSKLFDAYNCTDTSQYVFEGGGTSSTAGKVFLSGYEEVLLHYNMGTYTSTGTYTVRLYTQSGVEDFWANVNADIVITGTTTGNLNISETAAKAFRAGVTTTATGTTALSVTLDRRRKKK